MPRKPLGYKAGFTIGSALIVIGLVMQLIVGAIDWRLLHAPANYVLLAVTCIVLVVLHLTSHRPDGYDGDDTPTVRPRNFGRCPRSDQHAHGVALCANVRMDDADCWTCGGEASGSNNQ